MAKIKLKGLHAVLRAINGMGVSEKDFSSPGLEILPTKYELKDNPSGNKALTTVEMNEVPPTGDLINKGINSWHPTDFPAVNFQFNFTGHGHDFYKYGDNQPGGQDPGQAIHTGSRVYPFNGSISEYNAPGYTRIIAKRSGKKIIDVKSQYQPGNTIFIAETQGGLNWHSGRIDELRGQMTKFNKEIFDKLGIFNNDDTVVGSKKSDFLYGGNGQDKLDGKKGNDILIGGDGSDVMKGGKSQDLFVIDDSSRDVITDYDKSDLIELESQLSNYSINIKTSSIEVIHNLSGGNVLEITDYTNMPNFVVPGTHNSVISGFKNFGSIKVIDDQY